MNKLELYGMKVIVDDSMVEIARSWRERLFTRPWRPFTRFRREPALKGGEVLKNGNLLIMSSSTKQALEMAIDLELRRSP